jgi:Cu/Ag efflux protein CusF
VAESLRRALLLALTFMVVGCSRGAATTTTPADARAIAAPLIERSATGVIRTIGANRAYASIAHDRIEGYMEPMTMAFEFRSPAQSEGLSRGDRVRFSFVTDEERGRMTITTIAREPGPDR